MGPVCGSNGNATWNVAWRSCTATDCSLTRYLANTAWVGCLQCAMSVTTTAGADAAAALGISTACEQPAASIQAATTSPPRGFMPWAPTPTRAPP